MKLKLFTLSLAFLAITACNIEPLESDSENASNLQADALKAKGISNAPTNSGAFVMRYPLAGALAFTLIDAKSELVITINYPDILPVYCGGDQPMDVINIQDIIAGKKEQRLLSIASGEVETRVFQGPFVYDNNLQEFCSWISTATILAEGKATLSYRDNDSFATFNPNYTNAFGFNLRGRLITSEGKAWHVRAGANYLWNADTEPISSIVDIEKTVSVRLN